MNTLTKLGCPFVVAVVLALTSAPAHAQLFKEEELGPMQQFAPFLEMMKQRMGKKRYAAMMRKMGPMMANTAGNNGNGFGGNFGAGFHGAPTGGGWGGFDFGGYSGGDFGGFANMFGSGQGMGDLMGMIDGFTGRHGRRASRHRHAR